VGVPRFILALDQGTTSSRAIVFDQTGRIVAQGQREFRQLYPRPAWVEHDPEAIWRSQLTAMRQAMAGAGLVGAEVAAIGITNQRETTVVWERATGQPIHNAIVWQDRRTAPLCDALRAAGHEPAIRQRTGLVLDPYFSATKLEWLLHNVPDAQRRAEAGDLAFGTIDTYLIWRLTGGRLHITDPSNAARTMLYNIHTHEWDDDLLRLLDIPRAVLPEVVPSSGIHGETEPALLGRPLPIAGIAGDQQAALFGQAAHHAGMAKNTYGTGCFTLLTTGPRPVTSSHGLLTTIAWQIGETVTYALEGSIFVTGAAVQWLRDGLGLIKNAAEVEALAASVPDTGGVVVVPAFTGLGAPHWDAYARGSIFGLTRGTTGAHIARATLESIALQTRDVLKAMTDDARTGMDELRVDGGATANNLLMQMQADLLSAPVVRPAVAEVTALGAAYLAGLATGYWPSLEAIAANWRAERTFYPTMPAHQLARILRAWDRGIHRSLRWAADE
jgi:glycerol kinase